MPCAVVRACFASRAAALVLLLIAAAAASAGEIPTDTNAIEQLTPAEARKLVAEFPGANVKFAPAHDTTITTSSRGLPLSGLRSLDAETAKALAAYEGELVLGGLTSLDAAAAEALTNGKAYSIYLHGLTELDADTARVLAASKKVQSWLSKLTTLDDAAAAALADFKVQDLYLDGLTVISPQVAQSLSRSAAVNLHLNGVTTLSLAAAQALAGFGRGRDGTNLSLQGLTELDPETAAALAASKAWDGQLPHLATLDTATAQALAASAVQQFSLDGVTELDAKMARTLADCTCQFLSLGGLATLDVETADALADYAGQMVLKDSCRADFFRNNPLTPETARAYAALSGRMLCDITAFESTDSVAIARVFAAVNGPLALPNLKRISPKTLTALIEKKDVVIPLLETLEMIPEPDGSPTDDFIVPPGFQARQRQ